MQKILIVSRWPIPFFATFLIGSTLAGVQAFGQQRDKLAETGTYREQTNRTDNSFVTNANPPPKSASGRAAFFRGFELGLKGRRKEAIAEFTKGIKSDPDCPSLYSERGAAYYALKEYDNALTDLNEAIRLAPKMASALNSRGATYTLLGKHDLAVADLNKAIQIEPGLAPAWNQRAIHYHMISQHEKGLSDVDVAIRLSPDDPVSHVTRGDCFFGLNRMDEAVAEYRVSRNLDQTFPTPVSRLVLAYDAMNRPNDALKQTDELVAMKPADAETRVIRGNHQRALGQMDLALQDYNEAIRLDPKYPVAWNNRGVLKRKSGDFEGALNDFNKAITLDGSSPDGYVGRGLTLIARDDEKKGRIDLERAYAIDPSLRDQVEAIVKEIQAKRTTK